MANVDCARGLIPWENCPNSIRAPLDASTSTVQIGDALRKASDGYYDVSAATELIDAIAMEYHATGTAGDIEAIPVRSGARFKIQTVTGTAFTQTMVGNNCDLVKGSGTDIYSDDEANIASTGTGEAQLRIVDLANMEGNALGAHADIIVEINEHYMSGYTVSGDAETVPGPDGV